MFGLINKIKDFYYKQKYPCLFEDNVNYGTRIIETKEQKDLRQKREKDAAKCPICGTSNISWVYGNHEVTCKKCGCDYEYYWKD